MNAEPRTFVDTNILVYGRLLSEDLQHGRRFGAVTVINPFEPEAVP